MVHSIMETCITISLLESIFSLIFTRGFNATSPCSTFGNILFMSQLGLDNDPAAL